MPKIARSEENFRNEAEKRHPRMFQDERDEAQTREGIRGKRIAQDDETTRSIKN